MERIAPTEQDRHTFSHDGQKVYEWDQTLEEVNVYVDVPPGVPAKILFCDVTTTHVQFGIKGNPPFLSHDLECPANSEESFWTLEDGVLHITLTKREQGASWSAVFKGHEALDPITGEKDRKRLMLERFQAEHPGFDFSGADFNGECPDPRNFMGGMKHQ